MGVDLNVVFAATVTAEEAFALPARLDRAPAVVAACRRLTTLSSVALASVGLAW